MWYCHEMMISLQMLKTGFDTKLHWGKITWTNIEYCWQFEVHIISCFSSDEALFLFLIHFRRKDGPYWSLDASLFTVQNASEISKLFTLFALLQWIWFSHDSDICSLCWSPDSKRFAIVSNDESFAMYEADTGDIQSSISSLQKIDFCIKEVFNEWARRIKFAERKS